MACKGNLRGSRFAIVLIFAGHLTFESCGMNIRHLFRDVLERLAGDLRTTIDYTQLAGGTCFSAEDGGPGSACHQIAICITSSLILT